MANDTLPLPVLGSNEGNTFFDVPHHGGSDYSRSFGGPREGRLYHSGVDIPGVVGDPVVAVQGGVIRRAEFSGTSTSPGYGWVVDIEYADGTVHRMAHLDQIAPDLERGDIVEAGHTIGTLGHSGNADAAFPHVHYEVLFKDYYDAHEGTPQGRQTSAQDLYAGRMDARQYFAGVDPHSVLYRGIQGRGSDVAGLQLALNATGADLAVDGDFGPATQAALAQYQRNNGILAYNLFGRTDPVTGALYPETTRFLMRDIAHRYLPDMFTQRVFAPHPPIPTPNPLHGSLGMIPQPSLPASPPTMPSVNYASAMGATNYRPPAPAPVNYAEAMAAQSYRPPVTTGVPYPEFIMGLQSLKPVPGLLDVEAMEAAERNAARKAALTAAAMRNAPSTPKRFVDPAADEDEDDEPRDSDPVDVWMKKRRRQVGSGTSNSAYPTTSTSSSKSKSMSSAQQTNPASKKPTASASKPSTSTTKPKLIVA